MLYWNAILDETGGHGRSPVHGNRTECAASGLIINRHARNYVPDLWYLAFSKFVRPGGAVETTAAQKRARILSNARRSYVARYEQPNENTTSSQVKGKTLTSSCRAVDHHGDCDLTTCSLF